MQSAKYANNHMIRSTHQIIYLLMYKLHFTYSVNRTNCTSRTVSTVQTALHVQCQPYKLYFTYSVNRTNCTSRTVSTVQTALHVQCQPYKLYFTYSVNRTNCTSRSVSTLQTPLHVQCQPYKLHFTYSVNRTNCTSRTVSSVQTALHVQCQPYKLHFTFSVNRTNCTSRSVSTLQTALHVQCQPYKLHFKFIVNRTNCTSRTVSTVQTALHVQCQPYKLYFTYSVNLSGPWLARPASCVWGLWWTKWHWRRFLPEKLQFPVGGVDLPMLHSHLQHHLFRKDERGKICKPVGHQRALDIKILANCCVFRRLYRISSYGQPTRGCSLRWSLGGEFTMYECKDERGRKGHKRPQTWQVLPTERNLFRNWASVSCMQVGSQQTCVGSG